MMIETMSSKRAKNDRRLDAVFTALADPTRRRIVARLARGPTFVGDLAEPFAMSLPAVSKHLGVLERAGLVHRERDGRMRRCRLDARPLAPAALFIHRYRAFWESKLAELARYVEPLHAKSRHAPPKRRQGVA
jgi:DNA-binding transcriptional ArsR family regulator